MRRAVLIAANGAPWEAALVVALDGPEHGISIVRRCVDIVELLAVAASGLAQAALIAADLPHLDADAIDRLRVAGVTPIGLLDRDDSISQSRLRALGVDFLAPVDADPRVIASVIEEAVTSLGRNENGRGFSDPAAATSTVISSVADGSGEDGSDRSSPPRRGSVIAVWGPTGAPGRTTVAVTLADEISRLGSASLLIDADVYGGVIGQVLGLLDESAGLAAVCRQASTARLDGPTLAASCWQLRPLFRVLTGIPRAERWPELRPSALTAVLATARGLADFVVVDCGFSLESDEELSFDSMAPRRNGATLAILDDADLVLIIGAADPIGMQRLVRGLIELRDAEITATTWVLLNKVRSSVVPGDPGAELRDALTRFSGRVPAGLLPLDQAGVDAAIAAGKTMAEARPSSPLRRAIVELAASIAGVPAPAARRHRRRS